MLFFGLCLVLLWLVRLGSCASYEFVGLGIMPMQVTPNKHLSVFIQGGNHNEKLKRTRKCCSSDFSDSVQFGYLQPGE